MVRNQKTEGAWSVFHVSAILFLLAVVCQFPQVLHPEFGLGSRYENGAIARSLVDHGVFGDPFEPVRTGPTAAEPPLFPLYLAAVLRIFRSPAVISCVVTFANVAVNALIAALLPVLSLALFAEMGGGVAAGLLWIAGCRVMPGWDASYVLLGFILFAWFTVRRRFKLAGYAAGLLAGMIMLLNPAASLVILPWLAYLWSESRDPWRARARFMATALCVAAVCNVPWLIRNYRVWGYPVLRTNFGMTLYSSNNSCAEITTGDNMASGCYGRTHPAFSPIEVERMRRLGEVEYDRRRTAEGFAWIRSNPSRFARLTASRMLFFWLPVRWGARYQLYTLCLITIFSVPGVLLLARRRRNLALFFGWVWATYPAIYYVIMADDRYRYPILWTSLLPAGYAAAALWRRAMNASRQAVACGPAAQNAIEQ